MTSPEIEDTMQIVQPIGTVGFSPKAVLAFLFPLIAAIVAAAVDWIMSGQFDTTTIRTAAAGLGASALALLGAWLGAPGSVIVETGESVPDMTLGTYDESPPKT